MEQKSECLLLCLMASITLGSKLSAILLLILLNLCPLWVARHKIWFYMPPNLAHPIIL